MHTPQQQPRELNQSSSRNLAHIYIIYVLEKQMDRSMDGWWQAQSPLLPVCCTEAHARPRKVLGTSLIRRSIDPINSNREYVHTPQKQPQELKQSAQVRGWLEGVAKPSNGTCIYIYIHTPVPQIPNPTLTLPWSNAQPCPCRVTFSQTTMFI